MSLDPVAVTFWNYAYPDKPGFSNDLIGTVLSIQETQKSVYGQPGVPDFYSDGKPIMQIRMLFLLQNGQLISWCFPKANAAARRGEKPSVHMDLFGLTGNTGMRNLIGKTVKISTVPGSYGAGNPRPWSVEDLSDQFAFATDIEDNQYTFNGMRLTFPEIYTVPEVLMNNAASGGQVVQPQPVPMPNPMPQSAPTVYPQAMPMSAPMPAGMDPNVAAAMQQFGATNVQMVTPVQQQMAQANPVTGEIYEDIPL